MLQVIIFSLLGGVLSLTAAIVLLKNDKTATGLAKYATPFAAGVLLAAAFTDLLPEAIEEADARSVLLAALIGLLVFFILERFLKFFHHHHEGEHEAENKSSNSLIIIGDTLHNALDGVAIGAAFLISPSTGIIAAFAVALHEIPQEIGDFGLLLKNGMKKKKVLLVNIVSALATTLTAVIVFAIGDAESSYIPYALAATAGFFIYIAASDIIPEIHQKVTPGTKDIRPWLVLLGAVFIMIVSPLAHGYIDAGHDHDDNGHSHSEHSSDHDDHSDNDDHSHDDDHKDHEDDKTDSNKEHGDHDSDHEDEDHVDHDKDIKE
jgi:zinc and cadmium transporter